MPGRTAPPHPPSSCRPGRLAVAGCAFALALVPTLGAAVPPAKEAPRPRPASRTESAAAREQARRCERLDGMEAALACRSALALGISASRRAGIRTLLARRLVALERWDELADLYREDVGLDPTGALAWQRLGTTLLFALGLPAEAVGALEQAVRLAPDDPVARVDLASALAAGGRPAEAAAAFEVALKLDPQVLDGRPAARDLFEASRQGRPWP